MAFGIIIKTDWKVLMQHSEGEVTFEVLRGTNVKLLYQLLSLTWKILKKP